MTLNESYRINNLKFKGLEDIMDFLYAKRIIKNKSAANRKKVRGVLIDLKKNQTAYINEVPIQRG
ncbi:hypothetical protein HN803_07100 [candidate division WWE3 bacterium]|jgi:hypothetical protein|nr:hypothetical protein [candidate division WWE3 bacterium]